MWMGGFDRWVDWDTAPKQWLILASPAAPDFHDDMVADVAAEEITVAGYSRVSVAGAVHTDLADFGNQFRFHGLTPPAWSGLAGGQGMLALALALDTGDDATSGLIGWWDLSEATDIGEFDTDFGPWEWNGVPLPEGDATTRLVYRRDFYP
jgi:hypothetical protein